MSKDVAGKILDEMVGAINLLAESSPMVGKVILTDEVRNQIVDKMSEVCKLTAEEMKTVEDFLMSDLHKNYIATVQGMSKVIYENINLIKPEAAEKPTLH